MSDTIKTSHVYEDNVSYATTNSDAPTDSTNDRSTNRSDGQKLSKIRPSYLPSIFIKKIKYRDYFQFINKMTVGSLIKGEMNHIS